MRNSRRLVCTWTAIKRTVEKHKHDGAPNLRFAAHLLGRDCWRPPTAVDHVPPLRFGQRTRLLQPLRRPAERPRAAPCAHGRNVDGSESHTCTDVQLSEGKYFYHACITHPTTAERHTKRPPLPLNIAPNSRNKSQALCETRRSPGRSPTKTRRASAASARQCGTLYSKQSSDHKAEPRASIPCKGHASIEK